MDTTLQSLLADPRESIAVELKRWIDPSKPEDAAKIIKAAAAIYNSNGGFLVIGINNDGTPHGEGIPAEWERIFDSEATQQLIANNLAPSFEIEVIHTTSNDQPCVVLRIPSGVVSPVSMRRDYLHKGKAKILDRGAAFCRTLNSNGKYSSDLPSADDWDRIIRTCLDNRESDIARFLSRNFTASGVSALKDHILALAEGLGKGGEGRLQNESGASVDDDVRLELNALDSPEDELWLTLEQSSSPVVEPSAMPVGSVGVRTFMRSGYDHLQRAVKESGVAVPNHGSWEVSAIVNGNPAETEPTSAFLDRVIAANPSYTYVPMWTAGRGSSETLGRPYVLDKGWQSLVISPPVALNFWRAEPRGVFYLYRALEDDMSLANPKPESMTVLDFALQYIRTTDAIAVLLSIANAIPMRTMAHSIEIMFRWRGLFGRELSNWANPLRSLLPGKVCKQDEVSVAVCVPIDATQAAIASYAYQATRPLFVLFDGMDFGSKVGEEIARSVLERKL